MSNRFKIYVLSAAIFVAVIVIYFFFFAPKWGIAISNETVWEHQLIVAETKNSSEFKYSETEIILPKNNPLTITFSKRFSLNDPESILEGKLYFNNKYTAIVFINGVECASINRNYIGDHPADSNKLEIIASWRPRKLYLSRTQLQKALKIGENTITIQVENGSDFTTVSSKKMALHFLSKGNKNEFDLQLKITKPVAHFTASDLPIFSINTNQKTIPDEPKIKGQLLIRNGKKTNSLSDSAQTHFIKIERRGNTSQTFAKKSFSINLYDSSYHKKATPLIGLPASKKWVLYGPYADKSLIRNALTYTLYQEMGHYAPRFEFINLTINNAFLGIYLLTEKIQIGENHLNIQPFKASKTDSSLFSGGYLLEIDRNHLVSNYPPQNDSSAVPVHYGIYAPKTKKLSSAAQQTIQNQYNKFEQHLYENNQILEFIDLNSFIDYLIITEVSKNIDGYRLSTFLYNSDIAAPQPKFAIGPIWDYNFAFGMANYHDGFNPEGYAYNIDKYVPFWWKTLLNNPSFLEAYKARYATLRMNVLSNKNIAHKIDSLSSIVTPSVSNNFNKWAVLNATEFWPNSFLGKTHEEEITYLKSWTNKRLQFLDEDILAQPENAKTKE